MTALDVEATVARLQSGRLEAVLKPTKKAPQKIVPITPAYLNTLVRCTLTASPGNLLSVWDFSQVEARALAWAAQDHDALARFAIYDSGDHNNGDPYAAMAARIFGGAPKDYVKGTAGEYPGRHIGKQAELGCGYGMGAPKFHAKVITDGGSWPDIIAAMGVDVAPEEAAQMVVTAWRELHAPVVAFWKEVQAAAVHATVNQESCAVGPYTWHSIDGLVLCELPSGRSLVYRGMRCDFEENRFGGVSASLSYTGRKGRERTYGGKLVENLTQAHCRDLMALALIAAEEEGLDPSHTIHDEILNDVPAELAGDAHALMGKIMHRVPAWAEGMPIAAEGLPLAFRYGK